MNLSDVSEIGLSRCEGWERRFVVTPPPVGAGQVICLRGGGTGVWMSGVVTLEGEIVWLALRAAKLLWWLLSSWLCGNKGRAGGDPGVAMASAVAAP